MTVEVAIPGGPGLVLEDLLLDVNGTLTNRGDLIDGVADAIARLRGDLRLHVLSADTFGSAEPIAAALGATFHRVAGGEEKRRYLERLGPERCVAIGNGRNDAAMLRAAAVGIAVVGPEGAHAATVAAATVVVRSIGDALALLADPAALTATLRP